MYKMYKMSALLFILIICAPTILTQDSISISSREHYCYVQSPIDLSIFNLTTIQHNDNDIIVRINELEHLRVHICQPLKDPCNGKQDYAICLHSNDKEIGVGKEPPNIAIKSGKIMFSYTGDMCNKTHSYTVDIEMKCTFSNSEKVGGDLDIVYNRDQCNFQMSIETFAACSKRKQAQCDLKDKTGYYNLSPLINLRNNYLIKLNNSSYVILNICHSLLYGHHFHHCDHDTLVCLVNETNTEPPRYTRLGSVNEYMRFSTNNGTVHWDLTTDTPCHLVDNNGLETIRTTIEFICLKEATNTLPEYVSGLGTCHYKFRWLTVTACSEDILIKMSNLEHQPCKITDSVNNLYYDLSILEGHVVSVNSSDNKAEYRFSICTPLQKSSCTKSGTGVCKYVKGKNTAVSKGQANAQLLWKREYIYLNYTDGIACGKNLRSYTVIIFKCSRTNNTLLIDDHDPCATIITWTSSIVCKNTYDIEHLMNIIEPENLYNWKLLTRLHTNYVVQDESNTTQYYLNIGRPLVEDQFTTCTDGTGICKVVVDNEGTRISELNLGTQDSDTHITKDGDVYLMYLNGSICEEDSNKRISTKVTFICDFEAHAVKDLYYNLDNRFPSIEFLVRFLRIVQGTPTLKSYSDCKYEFDWSTTHACFVGDVGMSAGCRTTENTIEIFNFTYLTENSLFKVNEDKSSGYFSARYCKDNYKCNGTFVCENWAYSGNDLNTELDFTRPLIAFKFANVSQCKKDPYYKTVINIWCGLWNGIAESFLLKEEECSIGLDWDKYITDCHLKGDVEEEEAKYDSLTLHPSDAYFVESISLGFLIMYAILLTVVAIGVIYCCYGKKCKRVLRIGGRGNYENNIKYISMADESEPVVDLDMNEES